MRMGKASRTKQDPDRRARIAAQRAAERRRQQRNRIYIAGGSIFAVIIVVIVVVLVGVNHNNNTASAAVSNGPTGAALTPVVSDVTSVPAATLDKVGSGGSAVNNGSSPIITLKGGTPLTSGGKPEVVYMGAEYCPYCAAERWGMIVALSRFGTFSGLATVHSASVNGAGSAEPDPNTPTWTFVHSTYTSKYLTFTPVEMETNIPDKSNGGYTTLQTPTSAENALLSKWDAPPYVPQGYNGSIPFVDFGNKYMISGASYNGQVLDGKSWATIAAALKNPSSPIAQAVDGTANYITAAICKMTNNQPATACTPVVQGLESKL
jgi:thiol-disulfide isomerase/thioredoxin